jgi:hypothetical protein
MSNRVDFFQSDQKDLTIPAATVSVLLDGALCPDLELIEIVRSSWPEFSWARLIYNPAAHRSAEHLAVEDIQASFAMGKSIRIEQIYNGAAPGSAAFSIPVFCGQMEGAETKIDSDKGERLEVIAKDFSAVMKRITVYGQRVSSTNGSTIFLPGLDTIFNADGQVNATTEVMEVSGKEYITFCAQPQQSGFFSYAQIIQYLLCEYLPQGQLGRPTLEQLQALTENQLARDLDVTGISLLDALHRCCERIGLRFKFIPRLAETGPNQAIVFYTHCAGRTVELNCQPGGQQLSVSKTNIAALSSKKNFYPVTHRYIGQGDFKVYEATFELIKAWDPDLEDTYYDKFSPSTNSEFYKVKDVYRKWALNEGGDYTSAPYNQGQPFDFSKIFGTNNFTQRQRRFWPALSTNKQKKSLGYFLQVSFDGVGWWQYLYAFNNLLNECGIWLSSDQLDIDTWVAALKGVLRFRITASVISDERLSCTFSDGPVDSVIPVTDHLVTLPRQFKFRKVSNQSIFAQPSNDSLGLPDEVDDSVALYEFARKSAVATSQTIETINIQTPCLMLDYRVGDKVTSSSESRDLSSCRSDNRSKNYIERVQMDFTRQCTNLTVTRKRIV